jgi:hypothetical protein
VIETCTDDFDVQINASETADSTIMEVFDLKFNISKEWTLVEGSLADVPVMLSMSQQLINCAPIFQMLITTLQGGTCVTYNTLFTMRIQKLPVGSPLTSCSFNAGNIYATSTNPPRCRIPTFPQPLQKLS